MEISGVGGQYNGYDGKETGGNQVGGGPRAGAVRCYARQDGMGVARAETRIGSNYRSAGKQR